MRKPFLARGRAAALMTGCLGFCLWSTGCETTGDPSTGGIFWSEAKAKQRLDERQQKLDRIEGKTARTKSSARHKEGEIDQLQR